MKILAINVLKQLPTQIAGKSVDLSNVESLTLSKTLGVVVVEKANKGAKTFLVPWSNISSCEIELEEQKPKRTYNKK